MFPSHANPKYLDRVINDALKKELQASAVLIPHSQTYWPFMHQKSYTLYLELVEPLGLHFSLSLSLSLFLSL